LLEKGGVRMFANLFRLIKSFIFASVPNKYKKEFNIGINRINVARAKITAIAFIVMEVIMITASLAIKGTRFMQKPNIYYAAMYILLIIVMVIFLLIFAKLQQDVPSYGKEIWLTGIFFVGSILLWCAGISLLDQLSSGQIIVYTVAIIAVAVTPILEPLTLLLIYLAVQSLFLIFLPYFHTSSHGLFGNYINSTTFIIISWAISLMRYKKQVDDFNNKKLIQEKNHELEYVNKELAKANQKLEKLSQTDGLTGIFNRFAFDRLIREEWDRCRRYSIPLSLIMIDVDFFKAFNDNYGHQAGDDCLRKVSEVLSCCARRSSDIVARYGGEEFAIILPYMKKVSLLEFGEKLRKGIEQLSIPHMYSQVSEHVTISLGAYSIIPSDALSIEEFIEVADKALYEAKIKRNNIVIAP
jgi:diguanylate cyclase (GGDEF)-like protein